MTPQPSWAEIVRLWLTALTAPAIAAFGGWIALQQYWLQRYRLRHDLSPRRFAVFVAARDLARSGFTKLQASDESLLAFDVATAEAPFLFGVDVTNYLEGLRESYCILLGVADSRQMGGDVEEAARPPGPSDWVVQRQRLRDDIKRAQEVFRPYLDLSTFK